MPDHRDSDHDVFVGVETPRATLQYRRPGDKHAATTKPPESKAPSAARPAVVSLRDLYRFATVSDLVLLAIACLLAVVNGLSYPCMALVFGHAIAAFDPFDRHAVNAAALQYLLIAIVLFVTDFAAFALFATLAERQVKILRERSLRQLLHLDVAWFDARSSVVLQLTSRLTGDTLKIKNAMGQRLGDAIKFAAQFVTGYGIGLVKSWDLALVMCTVTPLMVWTMSHLMEVFRTMGQRSQKLYAEAGAVAEETLASMRTVASLSAEQPAISRYQHKIEAVERANIKSFHRISLIDGVYISSTWLINAVGLWYGGYKVYHSEMAPSTVFQAFFAIVLGTASLGQISPNVSAVAEGIGAAAQLYEILDTTPDIDASREIDASASVPSQCNGDVVIEGVHFAYPSRAEAPVMQDAKRTTIVIAHRLSTVRSANKIVVMMNGVVHEQGTHEELMQIPGGVYREMYELQAKQEEEERHESDASAVGNTQAKDGAVPKSSGDANEKGAQRSLPASSAEETSSETSSEASSTSKFTLRDAMVYSAPEQRFFVSGMAAAILQGLSLPASALLISELIATMTHEYSQWRAALRTNLDAIKGDVQLYAVIYLAFAITMGAAHTVQVVCFRTMAERLTTRLRLLHFRSLCAMDVSFFDDPAHPTGTLTTELATHAVKVSLLSGDTPRRVVQALTMFVASLLLSFLTGSVVLTLILLALFPLIIIGEAIRARQMRSALLFTDQLGEAGAVASQALTNVRTVMALGVESKMCDLFSLALEKPCRVGQREARVNGAAIGYSSFVIFATYALVFWYGGSLVDDSKITFKELLRSLMAIILSAQGIGQAVSWLSEAQHAFSAGSAILRIRDYPRSISTLDQGTDTREELTTVQGRLEFRDVTFRYPTRPEVTVLDGFNLSVEPNQTIGICGPSGAG
ncbi:hypothetical protein ATCC90586_005412 [Pythium insidiosum]|nr:hypothetical protein ATCC90586_005412 [Pythium insidiosum]